MRVHELEEGKAYRSNYSNCMYRMKNNELQMYCVIDNSHSGWRRSNIEYNNVITDDFTETTDPSRIPNTSTPIDTKVLCWEHNGDEKLKRYFAGIKNGKLTAFDFGVTSWSNNGYNDNACWKYMIIAEEETE